MLAIKDNREYTISEAEQTSFAAEGYDIYDDDGKLVQYGAGKTVPWDKYAKLMARLEHLNDENVALRDEIEKLKSKGKK